eukprot:TRINITY_DN9_c1_g1_i5.p2 TRINITY_DN9_c1_g1~~TRINITY_DN9_c1_g1_i5.p2  ORF type:complete len:103 (-),score=20.27 TRINITY_DN9_c1_g1_i5:244-552(-)
MALSKVMFQSYGLTAHGVPRKNAYRPRKKKVLEESVQAVETEVEVLAETATDLELANLEEKIEAQADEAVTDEVVEEALADVQAEEALSSLFCCSLSKNDAD